MFGNGREDFNVLYSRISFYLLGESDDCMRWLGLFEKNPNVVSSSARILDQTTFLRQFKSRRDVVHYLSVWCEAIIDIAKKKGKKVIDLTDKKATRLRVSGTLDKKPVRFVMFNGHGDENLIAGYKNEYLIKSPGNERLLKDKIVYCRSCSSAKKLGPDSVISGADAFIGYDNEFIFVYESRSITNPLKDTTASLFLTPTNKLVISILKGNKVNYSYEKSQELFKQNISKLLSSKTSDDDRELIRYLYWDYIHQIYHGDGEAKY